MGTDNLVTRLLRLWDDVPIEDEDGGEAAFRELYADPVIINGNAVTVRELTARARITARALADRSTEVLSQVSTPDATAVSFRIRARHIGPLPTPLGEIAGTGDYLSLNVIDLLRLRDGRIQEIWMVADYLGALGATGAVAIRS